MKTIITINPERGRCGRCPMHDPKKNCGYPDWTSCLLFSGIIQDTKQCWRCAEVEKRIKRTNKKTKQ